MAKRVSVTQETDTGRNAKFRDNKTGRNMNTEQFVKSINNGNYPSYHVRTINGVVTPCSNPDKSENNNLG